MGPRPGPVFYLHSSRPSPQPSGFPRIVSLKLNLLEEGVLLGVLPLEQPLEIGRRDKTDPARSTPYVAVGADGRQRWVIADLDSPRVPRKVCLLELVSTHRIRVTNIHSTNHELFLTDGQQLLPGSSAELAIPALLKLPEGFSVEVRGEDELATISVPRERADPWQQAMNSIMGTMVGHDAARGGGHPEGSGIAGQRGTDIGTDRGSVSSTLTHFSGPAGGSSDQIQVGTVLNWIEYAIAALQCPVTSSLYFSGIAQAVAKIIDMDRAEVILWNGEQWEYSEDRRYVRSGMTMPCDPPSESLLKKALATKQVVVHPDPNTQPSQFSGSLVELHTAIACPILDGLGEESSNQILGILYADRRHAKGLHRPATVLEPEQKLVAILTTAVASSIARRKREQLVTKYQQFFSPKVTEAISHNPSLLEGEEADVSVLFVDIRGFSKATDVIGPKAAMSWVSDTLSELSSIVLDSDGVLVDYVGDEMFAMWGAPDKSYEHAFRAASAAKSMMSLRTALNERYAGILPHGVDFGIGVCTGTVWVGNTGSKQKFKYGPMGRTVNMGSRIQGLTKQWGVTTLLDDASAACLPSDIPIRRICKASVVGMDGHIDLFELMGDEDSNQELIERYGQALQVFESGANFREAVRAFGELVQRFPNDGPSLVMLVRSVNELVTPTTPFSPVWSAKSK